jgi:LacI family transcriptional regulator
VRKPTEKDHRRGGGRHSATASRALNPDTRAAVNAETARACEAANPVTAPIHRPHLKTARTRTVGLLIPDLTNRCSRHRRGADGRTQRAWVHPR